MTNAHDARPPAGWYPDPAGSGQQRWWDGIGWTAHLAPAAPTSPAAAAAALPQATAYADGYVAPQPVRAPGVASGTPWIWLIVLMPLIPMLLLFTWDLDGMMRASISAEYSGAVLNPFAIYPVGYWITIAASFLIGVLTIVFAFLDSRALTARGIASPFHWAFAFLGATVYVIGRGVVVKRRTGGGLAPLWAYIGVVVVSTVVGIAWTVWLLNSMFATISELSGYGY